jgi:hypothetical protein
VLDAEEMAGNLLPDSASAPTRHGRRSPVLPPLMKTAGAISRQALAAKPPSPRLHISCAQFLLSELARALVASLRVLYFKTLRI